MNCPKPKENTPLNKYSPEINRGFELMLRHKNRREPPSKPKDFSFDFSKLLFLFSREITIEFHFGISKTNSLEK